MPHTASYKQKSENFLALSREINESATLARDQVRAIKHEYSEIVKTVEDFSNDLRLSLKDRVGEIWVPAEVEAFATGPPVEIAYNSRAVVLRGMLNRVLNTINSMTEFQTAQIDGMINLVHGYTNQVSEEVHFFDPPEESEHISEHSPVTLGASDKKSELALEGHGYNTEGYTTAGRPISPSSSKHRFGAISESGEILDAMS
jgi:hypothetical protein